MVFVDVETTGGSPSQDRITEIGIIRVENEKIVTKYQSLINPQTHIPIFIQHMTGINPKLTDKAPVFEEIKSDIREITEGAIFVAHNAKFDYSFLQGEFIRLNDIFKAKVLCSVRLSRFLYPNHSKHNLSSIVERFSIDVPNRHRAYDDAHAIWEFFQKAKTDLGKDTFEEAVRKILKGPSLPIFSNQKSFDEFTSESGIYKFFGGINNMDNELLYVGKSTSLRTRIYSHFTPGKGPQTDLLLAKYTQNIETIETAGDLSAQLLEKREIIKGKPLMNKSLSQIRARIFLQETVINGYRAIKQVSESEINKDNMYSILSCYTSKKAMIEALRDLANTYLLCPRFLGLEHADGPCFSYQIGKCNGACSCKEQNMKYNLRFTQAFANTRVKPWPFKSAVAISESNTHMTQTHIVNNWIYYKLITISSELMDPVEEFFPGNFDWDTYLILKRFLISKYKHSNLAIKNIDNY